MKTVLLTGLILAGTLNVFSQDENYKNWFKEVDPLVTDSYQCAFVNAVSNMAYCKFGYKMTNLTTDYLIIRMDESSFTMNGTERKGVKEKEVFVRPLKTKSGTFNATGEEGVNYLVDKFDFNLGGIYVLPSTGKTQAAPDFKLPASKNDIEFGDFVVSLKKLKKETKVTEAVFEVFYKGDDYAIVDPGKISVSVPDKGADVFANNSKADADILVKGEKVTIKTIFNISAKYADMQFANLNVIWNDAFQISVAESVQGGKVSFEIDPGLTEAKN